jgi:hypothetical protein
MGYLQFKLHMIMMKYCFIIIALLTVSCKKEKNSPYTDNIIGRWQLVSFGGGFDGKTYYPKANEVTTISFNADQSYLKTVNGNTTASGKYILGQAMSIYSGKDDNALKFDDQSNWNIIRIENNTLEINSNAYDGGGSTYVRK